MTTRESKIPGLGITKSKLKTKINARLKLLGLACQVKDFSRHCPCYCDTVSLCRHKKFCEFAKKALVI